MGFAGFLVVEGGEILPGLISNILRAVCIVFAIVFTIFYVKRRNLESLEKSPYSKYEYQL